MPWKLVLVAMVFSDTGGVSTSVNVVDNIRQEAACHALERDLTSDQPAYEALGHKFKVSTRATCANDPPPAPAPRQASPQPGPQVQAAPPQAARPQQQVLTFPRERYVPEGRPPEPAYRPRPLPFDE